MKSNWMKASVVIVALASIGGLAACQKKADVKVVKTERVVVEKPAISLDSLDKRVSSLERSRAQFRKSFPVVAK